MDDKTLTYIILILLVVFIIAFFIINSYGYNVSLMEIILLFIIFIAIIGALSETSNKTNKFKYSTPKPTPRGNDNFSDPIDELKVEEGKMPDFRKINFMNHGIAGLDDQLRTIFRSGLYSRFLPKDKVKIAGISHNKGIILHGPAGTGKTMIARFIARILGAKEVQVINGPEIFNKFVGASEENVRNIFAPAKKEYAEKGDKAGLYVVIIDEIDSVAPARGRSLTGVNDTVVNQFLTEMCGVDEYDNILVVGTTNRLDIMDQALLRSGRFDLKIYIGLPDKDARRAILDVHSRGYRKGNMFDEKINLDELSEVTEKYTGADLKCLLEKAFSFATERYIDDGAHGEIVMNSHDINKALAEVIPFPA